MIVSLNKDYEATANIGDYVIYIDPIWSMDDYELYGSLPIEYDIVVTDEDSNELESISLNAYIYGEPQEIIIGNDEDNDTIFITHLDQNRFVISGTI